MILAHVMTLEQTLLGFSPLLQHAELIMSGPGLSLICCRLVMPCKAMCHQQV